MPRAHKVRWHRTGRWTFSATDPGGARAYFYASPEIPNTPAGRRRATAWMEAVVRERAERVVSGGDWTLDDLRLAYLSWVEARLEEDERSRHTFDGHRKCLNLICGTPRGGSTVGTCRRAS